MEYTQNYALRKPGLNEYANVGDLNFNADRIDSQMKKNQDVDGEVYDPTTTSSNAYEAGDYVINPDDGLMYVCNGTTYGTWDATKWDHTTEFEEIQKAMASGGESNLADLHDVEIATPTDGQALLYDDTTDKWHNSDLPDADVTKTASGNPIEITDGADAPMVKCVSEIQGSQDLHGYDKPWVGGAGKNKFDDTLIVNPTVTAQWIQVTLKPNTNYTVSSNIPYFSNSAYIFAVSGTNTSGATSATDGVGLNTPRTVTADSNGIISFAYRNNGGSGVLDLTQYHYQIEEGTTATSYEPYSNICPITAYTEGEIEVRKHNIYDGETEAGYIYNGTFYPSTSYKVTKNFISVNPNTSYKAVGVSGDGQITCYSESKTYLSSIAGMGGEARIFTTPSDCYFIKFYNPNAYMEGNVGINYPSTFTEYEPYTSTTHTTTYPSAIYRGSEDCVKGEVTSEWIYTTFGALNWNKFIGEGYNNLFYSDTLNSVIAHADQTKIYTVSSDYESIVHEYYEIMQNGQMRVRVADGRIYVFDERFTDATEFSAAVANVQLAYQLATPTTSSVTPTNLPIKSLSGYNHIESSTGDMEIEYFPAKEQPLIDLIPEESGGGGTSYDTTEQVIGTWVDGRDVYRKLVPVNATWQNIGTGAYQSFAYHENWVKDIDYVTNAIAVSSEQYYANMMHISVQTDKVNGSAVAYWNDAFGGAFTSMYVEYVILEYVKVAPTRSLAKSALQEEHVEELKEELTEEVKEETKEEPEEIKEEPVEEVKEEETKEEAKR